MASDYDNDPEITSAMRQLFDCARSLGLYGVMLMSPVGGDHFKFWSNMPHADATKVLRQHADAAEAAENAKKGEPKTH